MLQLGQYLSLSPKQLGSLVQNNLQNESLRPLITDKRLLQKIQLELVRVEDVEFFMKHVFKIIRQPTNQQLAILKQYIKKSNNENINSLVWLLLSEKQEKKDRFIQVLASIRKQLVEGQIPNIKESFKGQDHLRFKQSTSLLLFMFANHENGEWESQQFKNQLEIQTINSLQQMKGHQQQISIFLQIIAHLHVKSIKNNQDKVWLVIFLRKLVESHKQQCVILTKQINSIQNKGTLPDSFLSRAIFTAFASVFQTEVYFDQNLQDKLNPIIKLSQQLFECFSEHLDVTQLGWLSIFALDRLMLRQTFEKDFHICSSILRQVWYGKAELVSECFCIVIASFVQKTSIFENIKQLEIIMTILTPKELKYLILKLNTILSESKKGQIIEAAIKIESKVLQSCIYHFMTFNQSKETVKIFDQLKYKLKEQQFDLEKQIQISSYSSYEKQLQHFLMSYKFTINYEISQSQLTIKCKLLPKLRFYKDLFIKDYFAEQFWINQQKMIIFGNADSGSQSKITVFNDFFHEIKVINLSGIMLLTEILKLTKHVSNESQIYNSTIQKFDKIIHQTLTKDEFTSNVIVVLQLLSEVSRLGIAVQYMNKIVQILNCENIKRYLAIIGYNRIHYNVEYIVVKWLENRKQINQLEQYKQLLTFYRCVICENRLLSKNDQKVHKISSFYLKNSGGYTTNCFAFRQIKNRQTVKDKICSGISFDTILRKLIAIADQFKFQSPTFKNQIVYLTYIAHSPEDNYYFRNHYLTFLHLQYAIIVSKTLQKLRDKSLITEIYSTITSLLNNINKGDTFSHSASFYKTLLQSQIVYILCSCRNVSYFDLEQLNEIMNLCLKIIQKDNYPLLRQFVQIVLCRVYLELNTKDPCAERRQKLMDMVKVSLNIGVPIILTLGYELIRYCKHPQQFKNQGQQQIHQFLVRFISCHTAYLRAICQYYLSVYLELVPPTDPFLLSISQYWKQDKDSQKIIKNVALVVQGFKEGVQKRMDFLGFERVEEYPSNRVKLQFYRSASVFYSEQILGELMINQNVSMQLLTAYSESVEERAQQIKANYLDYLQNFRSHSNERTIKGNMRQKVVKEEPKKVQNPKDKKSKKDKKVKGKGKQKQIQQQKIEIAVQQKYIIDYLVQLQNKFQQNLEITRLSNWYRCDPSPTVIVLATLLEKVHNFGHIQRTLNGHNAMVVVPSEIPLQHAECKELVPSKCDVQIVQIKKRDLGKFITLMKSQGYPMIALEQCSRSVQLQEAKFPQKFMLLLGNERLGAPSWLLNEGDLLVEIPQIGKIRSLNVHVSMVLCFWQYLSKMLQ